MNTKSKSKKGIIGITLAIIMIASIFAVIAPSTADVHTLAGFGLDKNTVPSDETYRAGDPIDYTIKTTNIGSNPCTVDIWDELPNGTILYLDNDSYFTVSEVKWFNFSSTVQADWIDGNDSFINMIYATGNDSTGDPISTGMGKTSYLEANPPEFDFGWVHSCCLNMTFTGTASDPGNITNHTWVFESTEYGPYAGAPGVISHVFSSGGYKTVTLKGYNNAGLYNETTKTNVYVPKEPQAVARASPTMVQEGAGTTVTFTCEPSTWWDASFYTAADITYQWTFTDGIGTPVLGGSNDSECTTTRVVDGAAGDKIIATLVINDSHCEDSDTAEVTVKNETCTLRVYGRLDEGAGDPGVIDPVSGLHPENPPYAEDTISPFFPQGRQAPRKDFITFDPILMYHNDGDWNNDGTPDTVYADCIKDASNSGSYDASEKIFKRMWYEPTEWYKDEDGDGELDLVLIKGDERTCWVNETMLHDYLAAGWLIKPSNDDDTCGDIYAPSIKQEFTYMMLTPSAEAPQPKAVPTGGISSLLLPAATRNIPADDGIDSFDTNGDGVVDVDDAVLIESESSLGFDIDNDGGPLEVLDADGIPLSGDETLVLTTKALVLGINDELQFFDHKIVLTDVFGTPENPRGIIKVYYQGHTSPPGSYKTTSNIGIGEQTFYSFAIDNTGQNPQGPFFVWVTNADKVSNTVTVKIGRMFGNTYANIFANPYWNQKQFYVDGVCYNIVAIMAEDRENFKYVTIRQKLPKMAVKIPNHTQHLRAWLPLDILPEMPQYNMNHMILEDVQSTWTIPEVPRDKMGPEMDVPALELYYVAETKEPRFHGELKEIYWENDTLGQEFWAIEWFQTLPWAYTQFQLQPEEDVGKCLLTSAFYAPEALGVLWDGEIGPEPMSEWFGQRLKFWYADCTGPLFVDDDGSLRIYGYLNKGPGNYSANDTRSGLPQENPAYTDPIAPFYPQAPQAPEKDFVTFNPIMMYHNDPDWNNDGTSDTVYGDSIKNNYYDASEKLFKRMWYEPIEWYKDEPYNETGRPDAHPGVLDVKLTGPDMYGDQFWVPITRFDNETYVWDLIYRGVWIVPENSDDTEADIYAASIKQEFTYMMLDSSVEPQPDFAPVGGGSSMLIPMASWDNGDGIDSFDADGDGTPDRVIIESERSLWPRINPGQPTNSFVDNDGTGERLSDDGAELTGDEQVILTLDDKVLAINNPAYPDEIRFFDHRIVLKEVMGTPENPVAYFDIYYMGDEDGPGAKKSSETIAVGDVAAFSFGLRNNGESPQGPFFVYVSVADGSEDKVIVKVGRIFGETWANVGHNAYWNQKQFYVDGVCYNVVAIKTVGQENFKYITFRQKLPKFPVKIPNHTQHLKAWLTGMVLPEMPQYNMNHDLILDVQDTWSHDKIGPVMAAPPLEITYVSETEEEQFHGELKEIYWENRTEMGALEFWTIEWFQTIPYHYTGFLLPSDQGLYMVTSAFYAPEARVHVWDNNETNPLVRDTGARLKWWFDPLDSTDLYVNPPPVAHDWTIVEWYDQPAHGGNGDGDVCDDEMEFVNAVLDYIFAFGTGAYPFGEGGIFDDSDMVALIIEYTVTCTQQP
ncbi:MAG: PKD domain-containing protein [Halobacteriota archaeon]